MDMRVKKKPSAEEVGRVFEITTEVTNASLPLPPEDGAEKLMTKVTDFVNSHTTVMIAILLLTVLLGALLRDSEILRFAIIGASVIAAIGYSVIVAWIPVRVKMLWRLRKEPHCLFLDLVKARLPFVAAYVERLAQCDLAALKLVRESYAIERKQFQDRGESLSGAITKLGILPGIASAIIIGTQLAKAFEFGNWIVSMVALITIFHVLNFSNMKKLHQTERVLMVLDLAIDQASE